MSVKVLPYSWLPLESRRYFKRVKDARWQREERLNRLQWYAERMGGAAIDWWMRNLRSEVDRWFEWPDMKAEILDRIAHFNKFHVKPRKYQFGSILLVRSTSAQSVVAGAYYYDVDNVTGVADDTNDGLAVAEGGDGPRRTVAQLTADIEATNARYGIGDQVYFYQGTYAVDSGGWQIVSDSNTNSATKLRYSGYPGQRDNVIIDIAGASTFGGLNVGPIHFMDGNTVLAHLRINFDQQCFSAGTGVSGGGSSPGCQWEDIVAYSGDQDGTPNQNDNTGVWKLESSAEYFLIRGCEIYAQGNPGGTSIANNSLLWYINIANGTIEYNDFTFLGPGPVIYDKRSNGTGFRTTLGQVTIQNNYLKHTLTYDQGRRTMHSGGSAYIQFQNNIHFNGSMGWGDSGGGDYNWRWAVDHDTFYGTPFFSNAGPGDLTQDGNYHSMTNTIATGGFEHWASETLQNTNLTSNYNLAPSAAFIDYFNTSYSLASWQAIGSGDTGQDANSVGGSPTFSGGATPLSTWSVSDYALSSGSDGENAASDGSDMGADTTDCGPAALGY